MIAVKVRTRRLPPAPGQAAVDATLAPEGLEHRADVLASEPPREGATQIYYCSDDAVPEGDPRRCGPLDVPLRDDLPAGHPLRGKRVLAAVPAGYPDSTIDAKGRVVPVDDKGAPVDVDALGLAAVEERTP